MFVQKEQKRDTNKLTTLAFKMIPILHNTQLATPKNKICSGVLSTFGAHQPTHQPTHQPQFSWAQSQTLLRGICPFGEAPKLKIYSGGFCPYWAPTGAFWGSGTENQILPWWHFSF
jgi:hypothetical protein